MTPSKRKTQPGPRDIVLVASGDSRLSANKVCWPAQAALEEIVARAFAALRCRVVRGHPVDPVKGHGFIDGQASGMEVFRSIDPDAPLFVARVDRGHWRTRATAMRTSRRGLGEQRPRWVRRCSERLSLPWRWHYGRLTNG